MRRIFLAVFLIIMSGSILSAMTIWKDRNIYAAGLAYKAGAIIIINVNDITKMRFTLTMDNKLASNISSNPDAVITGFLPKISSNKKITNSDTTNFSNKGKMSFSIAARVLNRAANGLLSVAGSKTYTVNGVSTILTVTGLVDPALLRGRDISSDRVADFSIEIRGVKTGITLKRKQLKKDEAASSTLTEQQKQRIIEDYLQKMLRELTR